jgi:hypothetical protein
VVASDVAITAVTSSSAAVTSESSVIGQKNKNALRRYQDAMRREVIETSSPSSFVVVNYTVTVYYKLLGYNNIDSAYDALSSELEESVSDGDFTMYMQQYSLVVGATPLLNATVTEVTVGASSVVIFGPGGSSYPSRSPTSTVQRAFTLTVGGIVGIVVAVFCLCSCTIIFYCMCRKSDGAQRAWDEYYNKNTIRTAKRRGQKNQDEGPAVSMESVFSNHNDNSRNSIDARLSDVDDMAAEKQARAAEISSSKSKINELMKNKSRIGHMQKVEEAKKSGDSAVSRIAASSSDAGSASVMRSAIRRGSALVVGAITGLGGNKTASSPNPVYSDPLKAGSRQARSENNMGSSAGSSPPPPPPPPRSVSPASKKKDRFASPLGAAYAAVDSTSSTTATGGPPFATTDRDRSSRSSALTDKVQRLLSPARATKTEAEMSGSEKKKGDDKNIRGVEDSRREESGSGKGSGADKIDIYVHTNPLMKRTVASPIRAASNKVKKDADTFAAESDAHDVPDSVLVGDWIEKFSEKYQRKYWKNKQTGETTWKKSDTLSGASLNSRSTSPMGGITDEMEERSKQISALPASGHSSGAVSAAASSLSPQRGRKALFAAVPDESASLSPSRGMKTLFQEAAPEHGTTPSPTRSDRSGGVSAAKANGGSTRKKKTADD